jgi:hypothetical protein
VGYFLMALVGAVGGGICVFVALLNKYNALEEQRRQQRTRAEEINERIHSVNSKTKELTTNWEQLRAAEAEFKARAVSYQELRSENLLLKTDLRNLDVHLHKLKIDGDLERQTRKQVDSKAQELAARYLKENVKWIGASLNQNNYAACKQRLQDAIQRCRSLGLDVPATDEASLLADLKRDYEMAVRAALEREEQARIRAQIREEQMREREIQREVQRLQQEKAAIQAALTKALAQAHDQHTAEIEDLRARLADAEAKSDRAISQAQLTKAGHVYVISNIGSFGEGVFKVGMTRRLEPMDRVCELGDASVPFPFDVHMMIASDDAPTLERALHRELHQTGMNRINPRREFFKSDVQAIYQIVKQHHGEVEYIVDAEAIQYRQSLSMSDDDQEYIENVYDQLDDDVIETDEDATPGECPSSSDATIIAAGVPEQQPLASNN